MKLSLRFLLPLGVTLSLLAYLTLIGVEYITIRWFLKDLEVRSRIVSEMFQENITALESLSRLDLQKKKLSYLKKISENERILAAGICENSSLIELKTEFFPESISCFELKAIIPHELVIKDLPKGKFYLTVIPIFEDSNESKKLDSKNSFTPSGRLILIHDMTFASKRQEETKRYLFFLFLSIGLITAILVVIIAKLSMRGWIQSVRSLLLGAKNQSVSDEIHAKEFLPILQDVKELVQELEANKTAMDDLQISWTANSLQELLQKELPNCEIIAVSNRQPYIHMHELNGQGIRVQNPASGLVTALEPIVSACNGVWIAHGSGNADREVVDAQSRIHVPPKNPQYILQRVWLTPEQEKGYYYGFSNEGIWPLCHIAHTRPIFRKSDWEHYVTVNQLFADSVIRSAKNDNPIILVQDYHFALAPRMIRNKLPNATILTFWHIPWPNPEAFGICPWREELLDGLLGSSIMGFHIRFHRNNFEDTVDRFLESRIDRESSSISYKGQMTSVRSYPISISWPPEFLDEVPRSDECKIRIFEKENFPAEILLGIGVERLDYTKGIIERFLAVERLLEKYPKWVGKFTFIQIAAPSRSSLASYKLLEQEVIECANRINLRFSDTKIPLIILKIEHHERESVYTYMRASHLCFVSSLHDGMNLVAKEFVASRNDEKGVLILSYFAGASRELAEALIVNPYDTEQCADALNTALSMSPVEQRERMRAMRAFVKEFNIYRWAGKMLMDAGTIRRKNRFSVRYEGK